MRMHKVVRSVLMRPKAFSIVGIKKKLKKAEGHAVWETKLGRPSGVRSRRILFAK